MKKCPICAEQIQDEAKCRSCGIVLSENLASQPEPELRPARRRFPKWLAVIVAGFSFTVLLNQPTPQPAEAPPAPQPTSRAALRGDQTTIKSETFAPTDDLARSELESVVRAKDVERLRRLETEGRVRRLVKGTKVVVVDSGFHSSTVRISSGNFSGEVCEVENTCLDDLR